jgi:hypothetical protein
LHSRAGTSGPPQKLKVMNIEENIAVAVGIIVAISFLVFFLFGGLGFNLIF